MVGYARFFFLSLWKLVACASVRGRGNTFQHAVTIRQLPQSMFDRLGQSRDECRCICELPDTSPRVRNYSSFRFSFVCIDSCLLRCLCNLTSDILVKPHFKCACVTSQQSPDPDLHVMTR